MFPSSVKIAKRQPFTEQKTERPKFLRNLRQVRECRHLGPVLGPVKPGCGICGDRYLCGKLSETTLMFCRQECRVYESKVPVPKEVLPLPADRYAAKPVRFDTSNLYPETGGVRLNPSIIADGSGYLFAYRNTWNGAAISIVRLNAEFKPVSSPTYLGLNHVQATGGKEDPRLFRYRGQVHVSFTGWLGMDTTRWNMANILYARLSPGLEVEKIFYPDIPRRSAWEKNHVYFEHDRQLYLVYSVAPHRILAVDGDKITAEYLTDTENDWTYGHLRGGAAPVFHRKHFYHFFHGMAEKKEGGRLYSLGLAVFEAKPPFRIVRITHSPLDVGDPLTNPGITSDVIFPGGAVYRKGQWIIAMGVHDRWSELRTYSEQYVESRLSPV